MSGKSFQISETDFGIFLLKKTYELDLSVLERKIFIDRFFHVLTLQEIVNKNHYPASKIQSLFARIYYDIQANNRYIFLTADKYYKDIDIELANILLFEFLDLHQPRLSPSKSSNFFCPPCNYKGIKQLIDSFLANSIYERFFQNVSSLTQFILAFDDFQREFTYINDNLSQDKSNSEHKLGYFIYVHGLCNALPNIVKRLATVSNISESDVCLNLLKKIEVANSNADERVQELERLYKQPTTVDRTTMQSFRSMYRYTDEDTDKLRYLHPELWYESGQTFSSHITNVLLNMKDGSSQNQGNYNLTDYLQEIINDLNTKKKYLSNLTNSLDFVHKERKLTLSSAIAKYPDISVHFPFQELDLYAVFCFVKRNLVALNLTNLLRLEEAIAQGYLSCMLEMEKGVTFNDPTNYLKQNCYKAILDFYEERKSEIGEHPKIQRFKSLEQSHKKRYEKIWNKRIESLLKNILAEIERELSPDMSDEKFSFADTGHIAEEYCQGLFIKIGQFDEKLSTILQCSVEDAFLGIWIDECDILLAKELSLINEDDTFIYAALVASLNKCLADKFNYSLPSYSCHQTTSDEQRVKAKLRSRIIESQKKYKTIHGTPMQNIKELGTLIKSKKFYPISRIVNSKSLQLGLSTILLTGITGILAWVSSTSLNQPNVLNPSVNQPHNTQSLNLHNPNKHFELQGTASWYNPRKQREATKDGLLGASLITTSHPQLPLNTTVRVTNIQSNKSAVFFIRDYIDLKDDEDDKARSSHKVINLPKEGAKKLGFLTLGTTEVKIEPLPSIPTQEY